MLAKALWLPPLLALTLLQGNADVKAKKDLAAMQGTWELQALEINGKMVAPEQLQSTLLVIKGDEYRTTIKDKSLFGFQMKLDPSQDPRAVDMILKKPDGDKVHKAIYLIEGDTLKFCRGLSPE